MRAKLIVGNWKMNGSQELIEDVFESFIGSMFLDFNENSLNNKVFDDFYSGPGYQVCETFIIILVH